MKFLNRTKRTTGIALPLLSLRSGLGPCGEFPDIARLAELARIWGMDLIQILPVNDTGFETSPYSALSAFALNPIYLRIGDLPELSFRNNFALRDIVTTTIKKAGDLITKANKWATASGGVPYEKILEEKYRILESLWNVLAENGQDSEILDQVERWSSDRSWVKPYACFVELKRRNDGKAWWEWETRRNPGKTSIDTLWNDPEFALRLRFHAWLQMRAEGQFVEACAQALNLGIDIMGDIPILMNMDSADVWQRRELFDLELCAGAPPDMYSRLGQNWGFPLYRWEVLEKEGYSFWKERLAAADRFYSLYRIDHVLGFFRIWAIGTRETDGYLGHFRPEYPILYHELAALGFDSGRIRWISQPHVAESYIAESLASLPDNIARAVQERLFVRIGNEPLFLFSPDIRGGKDIEALIKGLCHGSAAPIATCLEKLLAAWRNRSLLEIASGQFVPSWEYGETNAWKNLYEEERRVLEAMILRRRAESMALWERLGAKTLKALSDSVAMQACAEDLGAVPPCVPAVLSKLGIPGLRVLRWHRLWDKESSPYIALEDYPEDSVACISVHDSSNLRQWWEEEADRDALWSMLVQSDPAGAPERLDPHQVYALLKGFAAVKSSILVYPIQDLLAASAVYREDDPAKERINIPGTFGGSNWRYRMKISLEELLADAEFAGSMAALGRRR